MALVSPPLARRSLLVASALAPLGLLLSGNARSGEVTTCPSPKTLICIFLRGAADGLSLVVPHAEPAYYRARKTIAIARPGRPGGAINLDGRFGLHPRLKPLKAAYDAGELAFVHAVGSPHPTRSHFEAQDYLETAVPGAHRSDGWLARALSLKPAECKSDLPAVALTSSMPLALRGNVDVLSAPRLDQLDFKAPRSLRGQLEAGFSAMYQAHDSDVGRTGGRGLSLARRLRELGFVHQTDQSLEYPEQTLPLADLAALIKANLRLEVGWLDIGGWDTHQKQGDGEQGPLAARLDIWAQGLATFRKDLGPQLENVLVLVMTEFGRTLKENGSGGTDHGHGSVMFLLGGAVKGRRVYGDFPGLEPEKLWEGRDLAVTHDFRDVFAEVAEKHLGLSDLSALFPGYDLASRRNLALLRS